MGTELRTFNDSGMDLFKKYLIELKANPKQGIPPILQDYRCTEIIQPAVQVDQRHFRTKYEFGRYLYETVKDNVSAHTLRTSIRLWCWLTLFYFNEVCPTNSSGERKVLRLEKYMPSTAHIASGLDKHLLFFPWKMVSLHGADAEWLLGGPLREDSKVMRELANSYRRNVSIDFIRLARSLYFDAKKGAIKTGATTNRPGSLRRLDRVINQLDLTYDIFGVGSQRLSQLLPQDEFHRWLPKDQA